MSMDHTYQSPAVGPYLSKSMCAHPVQSPTLSDANNRKDSEVTAVTAGLQVSSTNGLSMICIYPQVWVVSHPKACAYTPCPTFSERNINSTQQNREMTVVHTCPLQDVYGPYLPVPGCGSLVLQSMCAHPLSNLE